MDCIFGPSNSGRIGAPPMGSHFIASDKLPAAHRRNDFDQSEKASAWTAFGSRSAGFLKHSPWDAMFVALALENGLALFGLLSVPLIDIGFWWNAHSIAQNFSQGPFVWFKRSLARLSN